MKPELPQRPKFAHKLVAGALGLGLIVVAVVFSLLLVRTWQDYSSHRTREVALEERLDRAQSERQYKQQYLNKLLSDPAFFERVARERLGYSREDEVIIRFEKD